MTSWLRKRARAPYIAIVLAGLGISVLYQDDVRGTGIAQVIESKSLPDATVAVIDPESGTSGGTGSIFGVRLEVGDIILFRFAFAPVPDKRNRGIQSYLTDYLPPNTELVGVRIIDDTGLTLEPRYPGLARNGCSTGANCNTFNNLPCTSGVNGCTGGQRNVAAGSVASVHADTGVFFVLDSDTRPVDRHPDDVFLEPDNGWLMNPLPSNIDPTLTPLLEVSAPYFAHNEWDYIQVQAFGTSTDAAGTGGGGNPPFGYASPVAGPQTFYSFEASTSARTIDPGNPNHVTHTIRFNNVVGPWRRIKYPGAKIGNGAAVTGSDHAFTRQIQDPSVAQVGQDVTPANPADAKAVRWALGQTRVGKPQFVELALRVTALPLDPNFFGGPGEHVNCGEVFGSDLAARRPSNDGENHPWATYIGSPACVFLRLKLDVKANRELASGNTEQVTYTTSGKNLSLTAETGVQIYQQFRSNRLAYVPGSAVPAPDFPTPTACPAFLDPSQSCLRWTLGQLDPSEPFTLTSRFTPGGAGNTTGNMTAAYVSNQLAIPYTTRDIVVIDGIAAPTATLAPVLDPTQFFAASPGTWALTGAVINEGNAQMGLVEVNPVLPTGWSVSGNVVLVGGNDFDCTPAGSSTPICRGSLNINGNASAAVSFTAVVPASQGIVLRDIDLQIWHDQSGFGGEVETYIQKITQVPVGNVRSVRPTLDCPIGSTADEITGNSEALAAVTVLFNLLPRGTDASDAAGEWAVTNFDQFGPFGSMYGGLEVRATAKVGTELVSELSLPCTVQARRECSDGEDNDNDGDTDFPADVGCESSSDNDESNDPDCSDGLDNDGDGPIDWPADPSCSDPLDETENGAAACSDGIDNDLDGDIDAAQDADCGGDPQGISEAELLQCQNRVEDDTDGRIDFPTDLGCHSSFDDQELDIGFTPQQLQARLLVVADTSGSMHFNTCTDDFTGGDGSEDFAGSDVSCAQLLNEFECTPLCADGVDNDGDGATDFPADTGCVDADDNDETAASSRQPAALDLCDNGVADDSRLFQVKAGLSQVIANFGEVEWGLMRFRQRGVDFQPPTSTAIGPSGGWQGGGIAPCQNFNAGELIGSFSFDNTNTLIDWMDNETNYPGGVPPATLDEELRGSGTTPIAGSLQSALAYMQATRTADTRTCRPYRVILVTDGLETCGGNPVTAADALFDAGIPVVVIGFSTGDPAVRTALNAIARAGSGNQDDAIFVDDRTALSAAFAAIVNETLVFETCNGEDDDCDGEFDEDFRPPLGDVCDNGQLGECAREDVFVCNAAETGTVCNAPTITPTCADETCDGCDGQDDDCDGSVDEGIDCTCLDFELCNGTDDDCDGSIDEDAQGVGASCGSDVGECEFGSVQCIDLDGNPGTANSELQCIGGQAPAPTDPCDGDDNDCDSATDEDPGPTCYDDGDGGCVPNGTGGFDCEGACTPGIRACTNGAPGACIGERDGDPEICNGFDDDCDGTADDPWLPDPNGNSPGDTCDNGELGACQAGGNFVCNAADPSSPVLTCTAPDLSPGPEACNSVDDDCDGDVDEGDGQVPAPPDGVGPPIGNACGPVGCGGTLQCVDNDNDPGTPNQIDCSGALGCCFEEICDGLDNDCDDVPDDFIAGVGADCYPEDTLGCVDDGTGNFTCQGTCAPGTVICTPPVLTCDGAIVPAPQDNCDGLDEDCDGQVDEDASCPGEGGLCFQGECVLPCEEREFPCGFGFYCEQLPEGEFCIEDPCATVTCEDGFACDRPSGGTCIDLCAGIDCADGRQCLNGFCLDCFDVGCGEGEVCRPGDNGVGTCDPNLCFEVDCPDDQMCRSGNCEELGVCSQLSCDDGFVCDPENSVCRSAEECDGIVCPDGRECRPSDGTCIDDPCADVTCPADTVCEVVFDGSATCRGTNTTGEWVSPGGGGCSAAGGGAQSGLLLALAGVFTLLRRRRRRAG